MMQDKVQHNNRVLTDKNQFGAANGQSPRLESALINWNSILSGTEQSWNNYSNLRVEWWSSMWSGAEVSGAQYWSACHNKERQESKAHFGEVYDEMLLFNRECRYWLRRLAMTLVLAKISFTMKFWGRRRVYIRWHSADAMENQLHLSSVGR